MNEPKRPLGEPWTLLRVLVAAGLVIWLLWYAGPERIAAALRGADPRLLAIAFLLLCLYSAVKVWTWQLLLLALGIRRPRQLRGILACYVTGCFFGAMVPSTVSTDALRAVLAQRRFGGELSPYLASVIMVNALNWMAACTMGLAAITLLAARGAVPSIGFVAMPLFCAVVGGALSIHVLLKRRRDLWLRLLRLAPRPLLRVRRPLRRFADHLMVFERAGVRFGPIFGTALLAQLGFALTLALIGQSVGIALEAGMWLIYAPLVATAALIPASVSNFGADQAAYVYFMSLANVPETQAFVASALLSILYLLFNTGFGAAAFVLSPRRRASQI